MKTFLALVAISVLFLSACVSMPAKKDASSALVVGEYELKFDTIISDKGQLLSQEREERDVPFGAIYTFKADGVFHAEFWNKQSASERTVVDGAFMVMGNTISLQGLGPDIAVFQFRFENRQDGKYLVLSEKWMEGLILETFLKKR